MFEQSALIPRSPILPFWENGSQIQSPSPTLGEGFRVRAASIGMLPIFTRQFVDPEFNLWSFSIYL